MKNKFQYAIQILLVIIITFGLAKTQAKGQVDTPPGAPVELSGVVDGSFNYQGLLKENNVPVNGNRSLGFKLYGESGCVTKLLAMVVLPPVPITNGLFTVSLPFPQSLFNGQQLYLGVSVAENTLSCEALQPVPYALSLKPGAKVIGSVPHDGSLFLENTNTASSNSDALYAAAAGAFSSGVTGVNSNIFGYGVRAVNPSGIALRAEGKIWSDRDSVLVLSPYSLLMRDNPAIYTLTPKGVGEMEIRQTSGSPSTAYAVLPINTTGTLFGSQVYIKSLEVRYRVSSEEMYITTTAVVRHSDSGDTWDLYIEDPADRASVLAENFTLNAVPPYKPINNSSWVQFTLNMGSVMSGSIYIYKVILTLTESPGG